MGPLRILVDLDDTVLHWNEHLDDAMLPHPELDDVPRTCDRRSWDLFDGLTAEQIKTMRRILDSDGFYAALRPISGAREGIRRLRHLGHEVFFVSTPYPSNRTCADDKYRSVEKHFGQTMRNRTILTHDKTIIEGDVLIDDRPVIEGAEEEPSWARIVFDQPWNQAVTGFTRLRSWDDKAVDAALRDAVIWR